MKKYLLLCLFAIGFTAMAFADVATPVPPVLGDSVITQVIVPAVKQAAPVIDAVNKVADASTPLNIWGIVVLILGLLAGHKLVPYKMASVIYYVKLVFKWLQIVLGWLVEIIDALDSTNTGKDPKFSNILKKSKSVINKVQEVEAKAEPIVDLIDSAAKANKPVDPASDVSKNPPAVEIYKEMS